MAGTRKSRLRHRGLRITAITILSLPGLERGSRDVQRIESPWLILLELVISGSGRPERLRKSINRGDVDGLVWVFLLPLPNTFLSFLPPTGHSSPPTSYLPDISTQLHQVLNIARLLVISRHPQPSTQSLHRRLPFCHQSPSSHCRI
jgi:hypothetical protein